jgi:hypothetical protein
MIWLDKYQDLCDIGREWKLPVVKMTVDEWVKIAEELAKEHGGVLPNQKWLRENGYDGLVSAFRSHPERFAHIKREKLNKNVNEQIIEAEKLAREHDGVLPSREWLCRHGHSGLALVIRKCPEMFAHIKQDKRQKTVEEHIAEAEKLVREHGGVLPSQTWLRKNGHSDLETALRIHSERFAHIKQDSLKGKAIEKHIAEAEKLAKEHDGVLPSQTWLRKNGHSGLEAALRIHSERFAHIKQEKLHKSKTL